MADAFVCYVIGLIVGFLIGYAICFCKNKKAEDGFFIVNDSDPEITRWIIDVKMDPYEIKNKKEIHLKVRKMDEQGDV